MNRLLQFILICSITTPFNLAFGAYGDSCEPIGVAGSIVSDLINNSVYSDIINNIDMLSVPGACNALDNSNPFATSNVNEFKFCIRENSICKAITKNKDDSFTLSSINNDPNIGGNDILKDIILTVELVNDQLCLTMPTTYGKMPIICRNHPVDASAPLPDEDNQCRIIADSCYDGRNKSQSIFNFSGMSVDCLKTTLNKMFFEGSSCSYSFEDAIKRPLAPFAEFGAAMRNAIMAALVLYVIGFGFKLALGPESGRMAQLVPFVFKIILVLYLAVGLGPTYMQNGKAVKQNGMTETVLPILTQATSDFASMIFRAGGSSRLCSFDIERYEPGYEFYHLWDAIDCRISYYFGMSPVNHIDGVSGGPMLLRVIEIFWVSGEFIVFFASLAFVFLFISMVLSFISIYFVNLVTLYAMVYISPIFIPMMLFERTKGYFDSWVKVVVSCALQPAIIAGGLALILTVYDTAIYGNCEYQRSDYAESEKKYSTFELQVPDFEPEKCRDSFGYQLLQYYNGEGIHETNLVFFSSFTIKVLPKLLISLLYVVLFSILFSFLFNNIASLAAALTSGVSMSGVTLSLRETLRDMKNAAVTTGMFPGSAAKNGLGNATKYKARDTAKDLSEKASEADSKDQEGK